MKPFKTKRKILKYTQTIDAFPKEIFPLICPVKEKEWLEGWTCDLLYSESGFAEENCVFSTSYTNEEKDTIWQITKHDKVNHIVEFIYLIPDNRITKLSVIIKPLNEAQSNVFITYVHTAVSEEGNKNLEELTDDRFTEHMKLWEDSVNYYLKTRKMLATAY